MYGMMGPMSAAPPLGPMRLAPTSARTVPTATLTVCASHEPVVPMWPPLITNAFGTSRPPCNASSSRLRRPAGCPTPGAGMHHEQNGVAALEWDRRRRGGIVNAPTEQANGWPARHVKQRSAYHRDRRDERKADTVHGIHREGDAGVGLHLLAQATHQNLHATEVVGIQRFAERFDQSTARH